ncbi:MAG: AAA family ATPase [Sulfolobales archaeon]|nr:AAA family ATPase [Sulfolobales archaeon]MDW8082984.1 AAA family ATPase [Sulfolobales archaeon]
MVRAVVCVTGMPGSGKTAIARCLSNYLGTYVNMGDVVRSRAAELGIEITSDNLARLAQELRREHGLDVVAREVSKSFTNQSSVVVVDGVRSLDEVRYFSKIAPTVVVAVHASPKARFERLKKRGREDDPSAYSGFLERDCRELELGLGFVIALADIVVVNEERDVVDVCEEALRKTQKVLNSVLTQS